MRRLEKSKNMLTLAENFHPVRKDNKFNTEIDNMVGKLITYRDWNELRDRLWIESGFSRKNTLDFAGKMKTVYPDRFDKDGIQAELDKEWKVFASDADQEIAEHPLDGLPYLANLKKVFPNQFDDEVIPQDALNWYPVADEIQTLSDKLMTMELLQIYREAIYVNPQFTKQYPFVKEFVQDAISQLHSSANMSGARYSMRANSLLVQLDPETPLSEFNKLVIKEKINSICKEESTDLITKLDIATELSNMKTDHHK